MGSEEPPEILAFFDSSHMHERRKRVVLPYEGIAKSIYDNFPASAERTVAFRKLLESMDAALRCEHLMPLELDLNDKKTHHENC